MGKSYRMEFLWVLTLGIYAIKDMNYVENLDSIATVMETGQEKYHRVFLLVRQYIHY